MFHTLARELTNFIANLVEKSQEEAQRTEIAGFVRMQIRLNEVQDLYAEFETFKQRCLSVTADAMK